MNRLPDNLAAFIATLSPGQRAALLQALLTGQGRTPLPGSDVLQLIEQRLWRQATEQAAAGRSHASGRLWIIYMLLRHGGMRLREIFRLQEKDFFLAEGRINAQGRNVLFAPAIAVRLASYWANWPGRTGSEFPLACDASLIRRSLAKIGRSCGFEGLNARFLRKQRASELANGGLHPALVAWFMDGKSELIAPHDCEAATRQFLIRECTMKTSARNVFYGTVSEIMENGILTSVTIQTAEKLTVTSIITNTSRKNLSLAKDSQVTALVKAPWVSITPVGERAEAAPGNSYQGTVENINRDELACEIHVTLDGGAKICALYANGAWPDSGIQKGSQVLASFSPFSVILTES